MKIIGLCGGSGSGKGTVATLLAKMGIPTVDTDLVYRTLTSGPSECLSALADKFGREIIAEDGSLDRAVLRPRVFSGDGAEERLRRLNEISHFHILAETRRRLSEYEKAGFFAATVDAPLLYESGFDSECHAVIAVVADRETRISRIIARDGISREAAEQRIATQISDEELCKRADYVIVNDGNYDTLCASVRDIAEKIQNL